MKSSNGTPKTLAQSVVNGINDNDENELQNEVSVIELHVVDYLAQKFGAAILTSKNPDEISALWEEVTGKKIA